MERMKGMTLKDFSSQEPSFNRNYEYYEGTSNKFWRIYVFGSYVVRHHGRHGSKGLFTVHKGYANFEAESKAAGLANKKWSDGYRLEVSFLDRFAREV